MNSSRNFNIKSQVGSCEWDGVFTWH